MKDGKPYLAEYQAIKQIRTTDILRYGKTHSKIRQITIQNVAFYNAINGILKIEQKPTKQQPRRNNDETQENRKPKRPDYKAFQAAKEIGFKRKGSYGKNHKTHNPKIL